MGLKCHWCGGRGDTQDVGTCSTTHFTCDHSTALNCSAAVAVGDLRNVLSQGVTSQLSQVGVYCLSFLGFLKTLLVVTLSPLSLSHHGKVDGTELPGLGEARKGSELVQGTLHSRTKLSGARE